MSLQGKVAIVTGSGRGLGLAYAQELARQGAAVVINDVDEQTAKDAVTAIETEGGRATAVVAPVGPTETAQKLLAAALDAFGRVDILVTSAGIAGPNLKTWEYPLDEWAKIMRLNVDGTLHCCQAVIPGMLKRNYGRLVLVASIAGKEGNPNASAYSASKAAVIALTKSLGKELAQQDIAVNCITPAAARTRIFDQMSEEHLGYMLAKIPRGRFLLPEEVASMVAFLASAENSFTTGSVFDLSGGRATY